jgi:hypothetical protein
MTIITTFITPYMIKIGWKVAAHALGNFNKNDNKEGWRQRLEFSFFKRKE